MDFFRAVKNHLAPPPKKAGLFCVSQRHDGGKLPDKFDRQFFLVRGRDPNGGNQTAKAFGRLQAGCFICNV
jgi:hypothetical protein